MDDRRRFMRIGGASIGLVSNAKSLAREGMSATLRLRIVGVLLGESVVRRLSAIRGMFSCSCHRSSGRSGASKLSGIINDMGIDDGIMFWSTSNSSRTRCRLSGGGESIVSDRGIMCR